jgi:hypothetical protein
VANTDFEGCENDKGYGDFIFLVICAQPSHIVSLLNRFLQRFQKQNRHLDPEVV